MTTTPWKKTAEVETLPATVAEPGAVPMQAPDQTATVLDMIQRAASDPTVDIEKMERLMAMHDRIVDRRAQQAFNDAMALAQSEVRRVSADASNPQTKSRYASYAALDRAVRPIYTRHGFSLSFDSGEGAPSDHIRVLCYTGHSDGFTRTYHADIPADGKGAKGGDVMTKTHAAGSAFTYGQRYLLKLIFNIAIGEDDDDGNAADGLLITAEQKQALIDLMRETDADTMKFLSFLGVPSLDQLPAKRFNEARVALERKKQQKG